jgi:hypothetical protein
MRSKGRPRTGEIKLRNGFYIEVCNKGMKKGIKIRSESQKEMEDTARQYTRIKQVIILGEYKNGAPFMERPV